MLWFLVYCIWSGVFLVIGAKGLSLHWFWNGVFFLLASGTLTYSMHRVVRSRLCPARLRRGIKGQKNPKELRSIVEAAFGATPTCSDPADACAAGCFAWLPLLIVAYVCLGLFVQSGFWRFLGAFVVGIPLAILLGQLVNIIAGQKQMLEKAKGVITDHNPRMWEEMTRAWGERRRYELQAGAAQSRSTPSTARKAAHGRCDSTPQRQRAAEMGFKPLSRPTCGYCRFFITTDALGDPPDSSIRRWPRNSGMCEMLERAAPFAPIKARLVKGNRAACEMFVQDRGETTDGMIRL